MERIGTVKVMCRATPVVPRTVKAKTIYQSGFVGHWSVAGKEMGLYHQ
jgi:hypothetical protein